MSETAVQPPPPPTMIYDIRCGLTVNSTGGVRALAGALIGAAGGTWRCRPSHGEAWAVEPDGPHILLFLREPWGGLEEIALCIYREPAGYRLTSLLDGYCKLGRSFWNGVVSDFLNTVVAQAVRLSEDVSWKIEAYERGPDRWFSAIAVRHLRRAMAAGMRPGLAWSAPAARNWLKFLITIHENGEDFEFSELGLWLAEGDGWSMQDAKRLFEVSKGALSALSEYGRFLEGYRDPEDEGERPPLEAGIV